ncbi:hypothetical protein TNCV_1519281 [Trichonephila clavipes]|nr:hypothetical protein TNCV_1519281 [Trichonephila clavipes]
MPQRHKIPCFPTAHSFRVGRYTQSVPATFHHHDDAQAHFQLVRSNQSPGKLVEGRSLTRVAEELGINKSDVSRFWTSHTQQLVENEDISQMDWTVISPDLNSIEQSGSSKHPTWDAMGRHLAGPNIFCEEHPTTETKSH